ncbi:MAG: Sua5/YciO/YrdC/YwlC family protein [Gammaproteobacteria bacterium]
MTPSWLLMLHAARILKAGGVVAYPTEAVFGLGCDPRDEAALQRILAIKQRSWRKGMILIGADFGQLEPWLAPLSAEQRARIEPTWPGPVTWLMPARADVPRWLRGAHPVLAVRVTAHAPAAALCRAAGFPLVSTSANISRRPPARSALAVRRQLGKLIDAIAPGAVGGAARPSEIRDLASGRVMRVG